LRRGFRGTRNVQEGLIVPETVRGEEVSSKKLDEERHFGGRRVNVKLISIKS
jgi:hypothetical protein